jgi:hypothetical protein
MNRAFSRTIASFLVLIVSSGASLVFAQQDTAPAQSAPAGQSTLPPVELPDNPGRNSTAGSQQAPQQQPRTEQTQQPSGTAVATRIEVTGGAASKPAGVAIAPPKQRQIRSLLLKVGVLAGAGVALGTVIGLSAASPGHVPGSGH